MTTTSELTKETAKRIDAAKTEARAYGFDMEVENPFHINFSTRDNGSVGDETPGQVDIDTARRLATALKSRFPEAKVTCDTVDEWVHVDLKLPKPPLLRTENDFLPLTTLLEEIIEELGYEVSKTPGIETWNHHTSKNRVMTKVTLELPQNGIHSGICCQSFLDVNVQIREDEETVKIEINDLDPKTLVLKRGPLTESKDILKTALSEIFAQGLENKSLRPQLMKKVPVESKIPTEATLVGYGGYEGPDKHQRFYKFPNGDILYINNCDRTPLWYITRAEHTEEFLKAFKNDFYAIEEETCKSIALLAYEEGEKLAKKIREEAATGKLTTLLALGYEGEITLAANKEAFLKPLK